MSLQNSSVSAFERKPEDLDLDNIQVITNKSKYPFQKKEEDAGYDLYADKDVTVLPGETKIVPTDIVINILTPGYYTRIAPRSGVSLKGIIVGAGVVDSRYQNPIGVVLHNISPYAFTVTSGMRIAQAIFERCAHANINVVDDVSKVVLSERGDKGFGSSGQ